MITASGSVVQDDTRLLERAHRWPEYCSLEELTEDAIARVTRDQGIDFATALLYDRIVHSSKHEDFIKRIKHARYENADRYKLIDATVAVVPGAFYVEYPHTGGGGEVLMEEANRMGFRTARIPTCSTGTAYQNGEIIRDWIETRPEENLILASLSKGGTDVKAALGQGEATSLFGNVIAWINVGGILDGSPMVSWILDRRLATLVYRLLFFSLRQPFELLTSLRRGNSSEIDFAVALPKTLRMINVVGFPLRKHLSSRHARRWHRRIGNLGPNDSVTLLHDAVRLPGDLMPMWGVDHYLGEKWDARRLVRALLLEVASAADLGAPPEVSFAGRESE